jgi:hypothetical protein
MILRPIVFAMNILYICCKIINTSKLWIIRKKKIVTKRKRLCGLDRVVCHANFMSMD